MNTIYAGFWLRFVAYIIDSIIIGTVYWVMSIPIFAIFGISQANEMQNIENMSEAEAMGMFGTIMALSGATTFLITIIAILYWSLMESSKYQATVGKIALGLKVTDMDGKNLDFVKALVRNLCKIISSMIMGIGYIMAGFTEKKQGLHDIIANTLVVKK